MRPPSSGEPGSRLKMPSAALTSPTQAEAPAATSSGTSSAWSGVGRADPDGADAEAGQRSGRRDPALGPRRGRLLLEVGHPTERPQVDRRACRRRSGGRRARARPRGRGSTRRRRRPRRRSPNTPKSGVQGGTEQDGDEDRAPVDPQRGPGEATDRQRSGEHPADQANRPRRSDRVSRRTIGVFVRGLPARNTRMQRNTRTPVQRVRARTTVAQLRPLAPQTPAPGNVAAPVRNSPGTVVS